jgi:hypothetical protein
VLRVLGTELAQVPLHHLKRRIAYVRPRRIRSVQVRHARGAACRSACLKAKSIST